ncbi:lipopolysaccharide assembly protein LapA domain-containing protein [Stieleria sp. JC731]|uniref:lipopolysaccharide assembly protein LapA domain-containing protein n=1 Tax=Pirellulaceae TaxID=2691357 RepID=UPI0039658C8E
MWARIRWGLIISGVLVLVIFSLANTASVDVRMPLLFQVSVPLAMLLALAGLIGFMVGALWTAWMLRRRSAQISKQATSKQASKTNPQPMVGD